MKLWPAARDLPTRIATGAFILHTGIGKWNLDEAHAQGLHQTASGAFPFLTRISPARFARLLAAGEIATGAALLTPPVPAALAGGALTFFSGALVTMYLRTPAMHREGSVWPSPAGIAVSKDVWMLGIGLGLLLEAATERG
ncbi:MAG TPA: hypothetical protein VNH38_07245 [Candidatus Dormibacteraeota bacterium]|nr:hypothetical protein [Candidatus Dormibacteraeota bacterium]